MEQPDLSAIDHATRDDLIRLLLAENAELKSGIATLEIRLDKNRYNSNKLPSSGGLRKLSHKSLHQAGERLKGGQKGSGLEEQVATPDHAVIHPLPVACDACSGALADEVTEHHILEARCSCGKVHWICLPEGVTATRQYMGLLVQAVRLSHPAPIRQNISGCFHTSTELPPSQGELPQPPMR